MNKLSKEKQVQIITLLVEGNSMRSASRITGASIITISKLLVDVGKACMRYHDQNMYNITTRTVQCDEIWSFVHTKDKNLTENKKGKGSVWTWIAFDADSRLVITWFVGKRNKRSAHYFMQDLASRINGQTDIYTDGFRAYTEAIDNAFGANINYGQLIKIYDNNGRYKGAMREQISGHVVRKSISTSYVERQNLTMRMHIKRFARKTNAFSKKTENHCYAIALHYTYYNFCKIHTTLRVTPAMQARITDDIWEVDDIINLLNSN